MAWSNLLVNQMVSEIDAQTSGFALKSGQSHGTTNLCITKAAAFLKYNLLDTTNTNGLTSTQLMRKDFWVGGVIIFNTVSTGSYTAPYTGVAISPNGDAYATILNSWSAPAGGTGSIYEKPNTGTAFNAISAPNFAYNGIAVSPSGDVYAVAYAQSIFKQTGGSGYWTPILGQNYYNWTGICSATNGDMYACESQYGKIFRKLAGEVTFNTSYYTHTIDTGVRDITITPYGDIYICTNSNIYKQTGGIGNFVLLSTTGQTWTGLSAAPNGNVFACSGDTANTDGDIFVQYGGNGSFISLNQVNRNWSGISFENNYGFATVSAGNVYKITY